MLDQYATNCGAQSAAAPTHCDKYSGSHIEVPRTLSSVFDNQDRDDTEYGVRDSIERLNRNQRSDCVRKSVKNSADGKDSEAEQQERFSTFGGSSPSNPGRGDRDHELRDDNARGHKRSGRLQIVLRQHLAQFRQHRGVRQVKKKGRRPEINENAGLEKSRPSLRRNLALFLDRTSGASIIDLPGIYEKERGGSRNGEQCSHCEYRAVAKLVAHVGDKQSGEDVPGGIEGLILPELFVKRCGANNPERDCCDCGP